MKSVSKFTLPLIAAVSISLVSGSVLAGEGQKKHRMKNHFSKMDTNGDEMVSRDEHIDFAAKRFDAMDENGDGMLTKEEIKQSYIKHRKERTKKLEESS